MPISQPICASGVHEVRRPKPIPIKIRQACLAMIYGRPDDENAVPVDFVTAAVLVGVRPNALRKWLHRPEVTALIRRERAAFRQSICAANEYALRKVRDTSKNPMGVVAASPRHELMSTAIVSMIEATLFSGHIVSRPVTDSLRADHALILIGLGSTSGSIRHLRHCIVSLR